MNAFLSINGFSKVAKTVPNILFLFCVKKMSNVFQNVVEPVRIPRDYQTNTL